MSEPGCTHALEVTFIGEAVAQLFIISCYLVKAARPGDDNIHWIYGGQPIIPYAASVTVQMQFQFLM